MYRMAASFSLISDYRYAVLGQTRAANSHARCTTRRTSANDNGSETVKPGNEMDALYDPTQECQ